VVKEFGQKAASQGRTYYEEKHCNVTLSSRENSIAVGGYAAIKN